MALEITMTYTLAVVFACWLFAKLGLESLPLFVATVGWMLSWVVQH